MKNILDSFLDYALEWVNVTISDPSEKETLIQQIEDVPRAVYGNIAQDDDDSLDDFLKCIYLNVHGDCCGEHEWNGLDSLKYFFPLDPMDEAHQREYLEFKQKWECPPQIIVDPISVESIVKDFKIFLSLLLLLSVHYHDLLLDAKNQKKKLDNGNEIIENHFRKSIIGDGYAEVFLPLWLMAREKVFDGSWDVKEYFSLLQTFEIFIYNIYVKAGEPKGSMSAMFYGYANEWVDKVDGNLATMLMIQMSIFGGLEPVTEFL